MTETFYPLDMRWPKQKPLHLAAANVTNATQVLNFKWDLILIIIHLNSHDLMWLLAITSDNAALVNSLWKQSKAEI